VAAMTSPVSSAESAPEPEEDWFGEGSFFDSGEELASALFALAGTVDPSLGAPPAHAEPSPAQPAGPHAEFEFIDRYAVADAAPGRPAPAVGSTPAPKTWSIRTSASSVLPPRRAGQSGWSIRNSVQVLHRTDDVLRRLREEAVATAFSSAAAVFRHSRAAAAPPRTPGVAA
jgi:hypothetical protein